MNIETYPGWLELPLTRTNFHGPKHVRVNEVLLYITLVMLSAATLSDAKITLICTVIMKIWPMHGAAYLNMTYLATSVFAFLLRYRYRFHSVSDHLAVGRVLQ